MVKQVIEWLNNKPAASSITDLLTKFDSIPGTTKKKVVGLERGPLSLVSATEEPGSSSSGSGLESREYGRREPSPQPRGNLYPQNFH
jgi:hypothetical protein